jgi:hypothetical protein
VKKNREKYENELKNRIEEKKGKKSNGMLKFIISNLIWLEWYIINVNHPTESTFIRETFLPLCQELLSVEESSSLPHDAFSSDAILFAIHKCSFSSTNQSELLCSEERKKLFGSILSLLSFSSFSSAREEGMDILEKIFQFGKESEVLWVMKEGGTMCVMKKIGDKRERSIPVEGECFRCLWHLLIDWRMRRKGKENREVVWELEMEGGIDGLICQMGNCILQAGPYNFWALGIVI